MTDNKKLQPVVEVIGKTIWYVYAFLTLPLWIVPWTIEYYMEKRNDR
jgi:hypothetical protein